MALLLALVSLSAGCQKPEPKRTPEDDGAHLFSITCARCHGDDGHGGPVGSLGEPPARNFVDPVFQAGISDAKIGSTIKNGKGRGMPAFGAVFTDEQVAHLTLHVRAFAPPGTFAGAAVDGGTK